MYLPFISLFIMIPVSGIITLLPKIVLIVEVRAMVRPLLSDATLADVPSSVKI